jgi:hypothetical protein
MSLNTTLKKKFETRINTSMATLDILIRHCMSHRQYIYIYLTV